MTDITPKETTPKSISIAKPDLRGNELAYVQRAIESSWISSSGEFVDRFEQDFASFSGCKKALSVANGTVALHLALAGLGITRGDEVIVPSLTFVATANCVKYTGAIPVFVDVHPKTWCIDPEQIESKITHRTRAIIAVHLYGRPADMDRINKIAEKHGLWVIEDAAEAHGARYKGRPVGSLGHVATFSFYGNKIMSCGEGGALTLNSDSLYEKLKLLRGQGMDPGRRYFFPTIGYNYRLTNVSCAILCAQLERFTEIWDARRRIYRAYDESFATLSGLELQHEDGDSEIAPWLYPVLYSRSDLHTSRDEILTMLGESGIETRPFFIPVHTLPPYQEENCETFLPNTDRLASRGFNLPTFPSMTDEELSHVINTVTRVLARS